MKRSRFTQPSEESRRAFRAAQKRKRRRLRYGGTAAVLALVVLVVTLAVARHDSTSSASTTIAHPALNVVAPDGTFTTQSGTSASIESLRGHPTLVWFVATWCPSCQTGTLSVAEHLKELAAHGVNVVELELAGDLGQSGPSITSFGHTYAGPAFSSPNWKWGVASPNLTTSYDPNNYLDIYYLLDAQGRVAYINGSPSSTIGNLLQAVKGLNA